MSEPLSEADPRGFQAGEARLGPFAGRLLFAAFSVVVAIDYLGLANEIAVLGDAHVPAVLAWGVFGVIVACIGPRALVDHAQTRALLGFIVFSAASVLWAIVRTYVVADLRSHADYFVLFVAAVYLIDRPSRIRPLSIVMTAVLLVLVARNLDNFWVEERVGAYRAGYFVADGNDFGWTLVTLLLFPAYLLISRQPVAVRLLGLAGCIAAVVGVTGTASRGAALALGGAAFYYLLFLSRSKAVTASMLALAVAAVLLLAPAAYLGRLETIGHFQEDSSAQGRLRAWRAAVSMAIDHPLGVGAGNFSSAYGRHYVPADAEGWGARRWISAHSVYFRTLGEYGFPGLALLLFLIGTTFRDNQSMFRERQRAGGSADERWPAMLNMGLIGYAVGGAFLGGLTYPHVYLLSGLTLGCRRMGAQRVPARRAPVALKWGTAAPSATAAAADATWQPPRSRTSPQGTGA